MLVIARIAGRDLAAPIERQAHRFELRLHRRDIGVGPFLGMDLALHRGVFRRHAESVPAHRMQHVEAHGALEPRHHVAHRVIAHVPHMDAPRRIGEHFQDIIFRARIVVLRREDAALVPDFLPAGLGVAGVVAVRSHCNHSYFRVAARDIKGAAGQCLAANCGFPGRFWQVISRWRRGSISIRKVISRQRIAQACDDLIPGARRFLMK